MKDYHLRNDILNTADLALREYSPGWFEKLRASTSELSHDEASALGISRYSTSRVKMSPEDTEELLAELSSIEAKVGKETVFSNLPISVATVAFKALLAEMREGTI